MPPSQASKFHWQCVVLSESEPESLPVVTSSDMLPLIRVHRDICFWVLLNDVTVRGFVLHIEGNIICRVLSYREPVLPIRI